MMVFLIFHGRAGVACSSITPLPLEPLFPILDPSVKGRIISKTRRVIVCVRNAIRSCLKPTSLAFDL